MASRLIKMAKTSWTYSTRAITLLNPAFELANAYSALRPPKKINDTKYRHFSTDKEIVSVSIFTHLNGEICGPTAPKKR